MIYFFKSRGHAIPSLTLTIDLKSLIVICPDGLLQIIRKVYYGIGFPVNRERLFVGPVESVDVLKESLEMSKPFCGAHKLMEGAILVKQALFLVAELSVLYLMSIDFWVVNRYIDTVVFAAGHLWNFVYYKKKCQDHTLTWQTVIEVVNLIVSLGLIFLLFQLAPNVSIEMYQKQQSNSEVLGLLVVQFLLMNAIGSQFVGIIKGLISMQSRCYINASRKKNSKLLMASTYIPFSGLHEPTAVSSLLEDLENEIDEESQRNDQSILEVEQ